MIAAILNGDEAAVQELLDGGADVDALLPDLSATALFFASSQGSIEILEKLLEHGAAVDKGNGGMTPLHMAAARARFDVIKRLRLYGADPELVSQHGYIAATYTDLQYCPEISDWLRQTADFTPLHIAVDLRDSSAVERLLLQSINPEDANNSLNKSPLDLAIAETSICRLPSNAKVVQLIQDAKVWDRKKNQNAWPTKWKSSAAALMSVQKHYGKLLESGELTPQTHTDYNTLEQKQEVTACLPDDIFFNILSFTSRAWFD